MFVATICKRGREIEQRQHITCYRKCVYGLDSRVLSGLKLTDAINVCQFSEFNILRFAMSDVKLNERSECNVTIR